MTPRILITGAAGLIGSALARLLAPQSALYVVEALGADQRWTHLAGLDLAGFWPREAFLAGLETRPARLPRFDAIIHLGASTSTTETDLDAVMRNNFAFTEALARWALDRGIRFLYASSAATYGAGEQGYADDPATLPRLRPLNPYAFSKHAFDLWALRHGAFAGPGAITGLKYFNIFGPREEHKGEMRSMVLKAFEQIQSAGAVRLFRSHRPEFADGDQRRDFLHVDDAAAITAWFLEHPEATGIFNVGSGVARTWNDLARAAFGALGLPPRIEFIEMPAAIRAAYQYDTRAYLTRLRAAGCQLPARSLEQGVRDYAAVLRPRAALRP